KNFIQNSYYIIFVTTRFLGSNIIRYLHDKKYIVCNLRLQQVQEIESFLQLHHPKYVINCAGITGSPNIFWCDTHQTETIENNITYQLTLAGLCKKYGIHLTVFGSGGIFDSNGTYTEKDEGNFKDNFYGVCRINLENIIVN